MSASTAKDLDQGREHGIAHPRPRRRAKGILLLTGHFGNWEVATVAGIAQFPQVSRTVPLRPPPAQAPLVERLRHLRFRRAGFGTLGKRGSLEDILDLLGPGRDRRLCLRPARRVERDGIAVDFLGHPASTFKSLAILALNTGAPVIPASSWREPDGTHVLRFEEPLPLIECEDTSEAIRRNTRAYNAALERMLLAPSGAVDLDAPALEARRSPRTGSTSAAGIALPRWPMHGRHGVPSLPGMAIPAGSHMPFAPS